MINFDQYLANSGRLNPQWDAAELYKLIAHISANEIKIKIDWDGPEENWATLESSSNKQR